MPHARSTRSGPGDEAHRPRWSAVLRALREAAGVTQDGWAAWLGMSRATIQRWESGEAVPNTDAEAAIVATCRDRGLLRAYLRGPLAGLTVTPDLLRDLLAEARLGALPSPASAVAQARPQSQVPPTNLPAPLTSFVGRERETEEVLHLLAATRLLTLTGAGGIGKSRLALHAARRVLEGPDSSTTHPNGVWLVELDALTDPLLVQDAVAAVVGVREEPGQPLLDTLLERLRGRRALLLLDNCEHLMLACAGLAGALLRGCPGLTLLATSREALGIAGETAWRLPPLSLPDGDSRAAAAGELVTSDAVRLFVERAGAARHGFTFSPENAPAVAEVCRRLDGIPLAIELAAARVNVLAVEQIAARLDDRFRLLGDGNRAALPRQQTLRAALDWSYDLLTEPERTMLCRLAVFSGGCSLEAAEAICGEWEAADPSPSLPSSPAPLPSAAVLNLLARLVEKSLLVVEEHGGAARYRLLETVRQYGEARLGDHGPQVRRRHRDWYLALAEAAAAELRGARQAMWLDRLEQEHANLRGALAWSVTTPGEAAGALRLAGALRQFWYMRGHPAEGRRWLEAALHAGNGAPPEVRAGALDGAGILAHSQGDYAAARAFHEQSLALWRALGDTRGLAVCLNALGVVAIAQEDLQRAEAALEESLTLWRALGDDVRVAMLLNNLGIAALGRAEYDQAAGFYQESLAIKRRLGDSTGIAVSLNNLGEIARYQGDYRRAAALQEESLAISRRLGATQRVAQTLHSLGIIACRQGDTARAAALLGESVELFRGLDDRLGLTQCIEAFAAVAAAEGDHGRAARLFGAGEAQREALGSPVPLADRPAHDEAVAQVRAALAPPDFAAAWTLGRALSPEQAAAEAFPHRRR